MKITSNINATLNELRVINQDIKNMTAEKVTLQDRLVLNLIENSIELYIVNKTEFESYNKFIDAYEMELFMLVDENEKGLINAIGMTTFSLRKGLKNKCTMKQIKNIFKFENFVVFANLKDSKSINAEINQARKAYEDAILSQNSKLTENLMQKSSSELDALKLVTSIVKKQVIKAEKKAEKEA